MAKKYYWLKLKEDFFRNKKIKKLRKIAGGDTYTVIYLKMQLLSLQNEGTLIYEGVEESFAEEIALEIDEDIDNVKITLSFLSQNGLLEEISQDHFIMTETVECIGSEGSSAERVRRHRALKQQKVLQCNAPVTIGNTEIDIEKEKDIDLDKKKDKEKDLEIEFEELWSKYPNKKDKSKALKYYKDARKKGTTKEEVSLGIDNYNKEISIKKTEKKYIKHGSTWFNNKCWQDEYDFTPPANNNNRGYTREEIVPDWFKKENDITPLDDSDLAELEAFTDELEPFEVRKQALQERLRSKYGKNASETIIN